MKAESARGIADKKNGFSTNVSANDISYVMNSIVEAANDGKYEVSYVGTVCRSHINWLRMSGYNVEEIKNHNTVNIKW